MEDCYYFLYSTCTKVNCQYRHSTSAKENPILCQTWKTKQTCKEECPFRHSSYHLSKKRHEEFCFWEDKGCTKQFCEFKHKDESKDEWKKGRVKSIEQILEQKRILKEAEIKRLELINSGQNGGNESGMNANNQVIINNFNIDNDASNVDNFFYKKDKKLFTHDEKEVDKVALNKRYNVNIKPPIIGLMNKYGIYKGEKGMMCMASNDCDINQNSIGNVNCTSTNADNVYMANDKIDTGYVDQTLLPKRQVMDVGYLTQDAFFGKSCTKQNSTKINSPELSRQHSNTEECNNKDEDGKVFKFDVPNFDSKIFNTLTGTQRNEIFEQKGTEETNILEKQLQENSTMQPNNTNRFFDNKNNYTNPFLNKAKQNVYDFINKEEHAKKIKKFERDINIATIKPFDNSNAAVNKIPTADIDSSQCSNFDIGSVTSFNDDKEKGLFSCETEINSGNGNEEATVKTEQDVKNDNSVASLLKRMEDLERKLDEDSDF